MPVIAGIDEAGYGPMLGPLVVSSVVFAPPVAVRHSLPLVVNSTLPISPRPPERSKKPGASAVTVCDSKRVYSPQRGIAELEKSVLSFMGLVAPRKASCGWCELLEEFSPGHAARLSEFPWYREARIDVPVGTTAGAVRGGVASLETANAGSCFLGVRCEIVEAREFNAMVASGLNKADLLFSVTGRLLSFLWKRYAIGDAETRGCGDAGNQNTEAHTGSHTHERTHARTDARTHGRTHARTDARTHSLTHAEAHAADGHVPQSVLCLYRTPDGRCHRRADLEVACSPSVVVYAGKQGGKTYYAANLRALLSSCEITPLRESPAESAYCICAPNDAAIDAPHDAAYRAETRARDCMVNRPVMVVCFLRDGEDRSYELALASLFAKYTRELHMIAFNDFWSKRLPGAPRTTGYHCDANLFLEHALPLLGKMSISPDMLVRVR